MKGVTWHGHARARVSAEKPKPLCSALLWTKKTKYVDILLLPWRHSQTIDLNLNLYISTNDKIFSYYITESVNSPLNHSSAKSSKLGTALIEAKAKHSLTGEHQRYVSLVKLKLLASEEIKS